PRFRFLHASTMDHPKNVEGMLRSLAGLKKVRSDWDCVMLGWDNSELRSLSASLGLDEHVVWKGVVPYQQVAIEMQQSSALLMFSRYENQPCVILEALCCGLPVLATAVGGIPEVIDESNGMLVKPEDEEELSDAMSRMISENAKYNRQFIAQLARDRFSYQAVGRQFVELYDKILREELINS
ncbi:MAG TPA: glycosyltransferase, partial [Chitinophagaceae bacterium]